MLLCDEYDREVNLFAQSVGLKVTLLVILVIIMFSEAKGLEVELFLSLPHTKEFRNL